MIRVLMIGRHPPVVGRRRFAATHRAALRQSIPKVLGSKKPGMYLPGGATASSAARSKTNLAQRIELGGLWVRASASHTALDHRQNKVRVCICMYDSVVASCGMRIGRQLFRKCTASGARL